MSNIKISLFAVLFLVVGLFSCEQKANRTIEYAIEDIDLLLEGPVFEGSNDLQAKVSFAPEQVLASAGLKKEQIKDIRVKSVNLKMDDLNFDLFESIVVQLTGAGSSLASVAFLNPVPKSSKHLNPDVSDKASFKEFKDSDHFYFVIDANLSGEYEDDIPMKSDIVFYIDVKE
jgi:hypothetical protein